MKSPTSGNAAEAEVLNALVRRGFDVLVPFGDGHPFDLGVHLGGTTFLRVQCKTARPVQGCLVFNSRSTDHGQGRRNYLGLADIFGVFFPSNHGVYLIPVAAALGFVGRLRLSPTLNNQRKGVRMAVDFEIDRWTIDDLRGVVDGANRTKELELSIA
jgi:hypothetical protein